MAIRCPATPPSSSTSWPRPWRAMPASRATCSSLARGHRCFPCANLTVLPTYAISPPYYTRAALAGVTAATVVGLLWALLPGFDFWMALFLGVGVGEAVSVAANQKRGPGLQLVGVG